MSNKCSELIAKNRSMYLHLLFAKFAQKHFHSKKFHTRWLSARQQRKFIYPDKIANVQDPATVDRMKPIFLQTVTPKLVRTESTHIDTHPDRYLHVALCRANKRKVEIRSLPSSISVVIVPIGARTTSSRIRTYTYTRVSPCTNVNHRERVGKTIFILLVPPTERRCSR